MKRKTFLESIEVKSPCNESWDEMFGNDEVRFCSHCAKDVHNLSAMTRQKAEELVKNSKGGLCVRYVKNPNGKLVSAPKKLIQIKRRATIAAGVLATSLTLASLTYAQGEPIVKKVVQNDNKNANQDKEKQGFATISGIVTDANGAVVSGAKVTLKDAKTEKIRETKSDENGEYIFRNLEPSIYELTIEGLGFKKEIVKNLEITKDTKVEQKLIVDDSMEYIGVTSTYVGDVVREEQIENLPISGRRTFTTMGITMACPEEKPKAKKSKPKKKKN